VLPEKRALRLTWNATAICTVGVAVAQEKGYFARHNLDVELINFGGSTDQLLLANRVIVFSDRPARIRADLAVDLPFSRHRDHPEVLRLRRDALGLLGLGGDW
jgi:ABC-type nitrate/sulfonate/bicarbonate transport system substrate-binding protein